MTTGKLLAQPRRERFVTAWVESRCTLDLKTWLIERLDNCLRIAEMKSGEDRDGWLEDAVYFDRALQQAERIEAAKHLEHTGDYDPTALCGPIETMVKSAAALRQLAEERDLEERLLQAGWELQWDESFIWIHPDGKDGAGSRDRAEAARLAGRGRAADG